MNRFSTIVWVAVIVGAALSLYAVKYQVQAIKLQVVETTRELEHEREATHVAAAEWAYLNRPDRLQKLAAKYLMSSELTVDQVAEIEAIPFPQHMEASVSTSAEGIHPVAAKTER